MFPIYIVSKTYSKSSYYRFQSTLFSMYVSNQHIALDSLFPIYEFCFQSKFIVSKLLFVSYLIIMSTYYRSKYFWNVKMGFEQFRFAFSSLSKVKGKLMAFLKNFFLDFSKSVPAQKILITTRFFCLIMLHLIVNCKNHHSEVCHLSKKIIKWVFLFKNCYRNQCKNLVDVAIFIPKSTRRTHIFGKKIWAGRPDF